MKRYDRSVAAPADLETVTPARTPCLTGDCLVPAFQSAVTGALIGTLATLTLTWLDFPVAWWQVWIASTLVTTTCVWLLLLGEHRRLMWTVERVLGADLDGDGVKGDPEERVVLVNSEQSRQIEAEREAARRVSQFAQFVAQIPVRGTAAREWEGELGRGRYQEYRAALLRMGWATWNSTRPNGTSNERRGWSLVVPPEDVLRRIE